MSGNQKTKNRRDPQQGDDECSEDEYQQKIKKQEDQKNKKKQQQKKQKKEQKKHQQCKREHKTQFITGQTFKPINPLCYIGKQLHIDKKKIYKCFNFNNIPDNPQCRLLKQKDLKEIRDIMQDYKKNGKLSLLKKQQGLTVQQISSVCLEKILEKLFKKHQDQIQQGQKQDTFKMNLHYLLYPKQIKQLMIRFLIRFNMKFRKIQQNKLIYSGPKYIHIIPGEGKNVIKSKCQQVLENERLQKLQLYQMYNQKDKYYNSKKFHNYGSFLITPKGTINNFNK